MRRIGAIALVSARNGIRSRGMITVLLLLIILLPAMLVAIRDDGSTDGYLQLAIRYPSALVFGLLAIIAVWAGSAGIADEISSKTLYLISTKPVSSWELWMGKWLGLMMLLVALLGAGKGAGFIFIHTKLAGWQAQDPAKYASAVEHLQARAAIAPDKLSASPIIIKPGESYSWRFSGVRPASLALEYQIHGASISQHRIEGTWIVLDATSREIYRASQAIPAGSVSRFSFSLADGDARQDLIARFENHVPDGIPVYLVAEGQPQLLVPAASFLNNYLRGTLIDLLRLSLIAAIGISAGSLLSLPVAALVSFFLMVVIQIAPVLPLTIQDAEQPGHHHHEDSTGDDHELHVLARASHGIVRSLARIMQPVHVSSGTGRVADGRLIESAQLGRGLYHGIVLPIGIGIACSFLLRRRELALPER